MFPYCSVKIAFYRESLVFEGSCRHDDYKQRWCAKLLGSLLWNYSFRHDQTAFNNFIGVSNDHDQWFYLKRFTQNFTRRFQSSACTGRKLPQNKQQKYSLCHKPCHSFNWERAALHSRLGDTYRCWVCFALWNAWTLLWPIIFVHHFCNVGTVYLL